MDSQGFLTDGACFVEFGAGKGKTAAGGPCGRTLRACRITEPRSRRHLTPPTGGLSHWVQMSTRHCKDTKFVLVDRGSNRYKKDGLHRETGPTFERVKMDIANLHLGDCKYVIHELNLGFEMVNYKKNTFIFK